LEVDRELFASKARGRRERKTNPESVAYGEGAAMSGKLSGLKLRPHLRFVTLCKDAKDGEDGLLNLYGLLSRIKVATENPTVSATLEFKAVVAIWSEDPNQRFHVSLRMEYPDGKEEEAGWLFMGRQGDRNIGTDIFNIRLVVSRSGLYWFKAYLDGDLLGKAPLDVEVKTGRKLESAPNWPEHLEPQ
jgi:hypothetical protein